MNTQGNPNQNLIPQDLNNLGAALNGLNQLNNLVGGLNNLTGGNQQQQQQQQPNYNYNANINDPNNPYNVDSANQGMAQSNLPGGVQGSIYNTFYKNGYLETKVEKLGIRVPTFADTCYKRIFRRNIPTQCTCGYNGVWDTKSNCGIGLLGCLALTCLTCPQGMICTVMIDDCYDHVHHCPNCKSEVGKERFILG